jgi:hypothetical protein
MDSQQQIDNLITEGFNRLRDPYTNRLSITKYRELFQSIGTVDHNKINEWANLFTN